MRRIKVLCVLLLILLLLSACVNNTETTTTYSNPFDPPHFEPTEDYPEYEGEVNPLKNSRTFEEITDACIKVGEEIDSEPFYHTTDGNDELVSDYIDSKYKVPECILNVVRYFKYSHVFYVNCFDCGDSKWAEQDMRIYIQVNMDRIGYKIYSCEKEGFYIILSSNTYRMIYFSDKCSCCFHFNIEDSEIAAPIYYGICKELGWPYLDLATETIVYPEVDEESEDAEEIDNSDVQDLPLEETQDLS